MGIKSDKVLLAVKQNNYVSEILNIYTVYDLDAWLRNPTNNWKFKNDLFGASSIVKTVIKKRMCIVATE